MTDEPNPKEVAKKPEELSPEELEAVSGGAVNAYLIVDGRPGLSTAKTASIPLLPEGE